MGETSATGVAFTRNPSTGEKRLYGEFLVNAQGEDVVAGIRTPQHITEAARKRGAAPTSRRWKRRCRRPSRELDAHLRRARDALPRHAGHRVHRRARQAVDAADAHRQAHRQGGAARSRSTWRSEGLITSEEAVARVDPAALDQLLHPTLDPKAERNVIATGLPASPGAASRRDRVLRRRGRDAASGQGEKVILVRDRDLARRTSTACTPPRAS